MLVGIDLDEVLSDFVRTYLVYYNSLNGTNFRREQTHTYKFWEVLGGNRDEAIKSVYDFYKTQLFADLPTMTGSQEGINNLARKNDLVVITSRPVDIREATLDWLERNFPKRFREVYLTNQWAKVSRGRSKATICREVGIDVIVEDSLEYAQECSKEIKKVVLFDCPWNQSEGLPQNICRVKSWNGVLAYFNGQN